MERKIKLLYLLLLFSVFIPEVINAKVSFDYDSATKNKDDYVNTLIDQKFILVSKKAEFLTKEEFDNIGGVDSYLNDGQAYWTSYVKGTTVYTISKNPFLDNKNNENGVRIAKYVSNSSRVKTTGNGTYSNPWVLELTKDTEAPTITASKTAVKSTDTKLYDSGKLYKQVTLSITAKDNETDGLSKNNLYEYYISTSNKSLVGGSWKKYTSGKNISFGSGLNGNNYLIVKRVSDTFDNLSVKNGLNKQLGYHVFGPYYFDNTPPTCTIANSTAGKPVRSTSLNVKGVDNAGGIGLPTSPFTWSTGVAKNVITNVTVNGTYKVTVRDKAGNANTCSIVVNNIDLVKPTCNIASETSLSVYTQSEYLRVTGSDKGSAGTAAGYIGVASYKWNTGASGTRINIVTNSTYTVTITDKAGNANTCKITIGNIDRTPPSCYLTKSGNRYNPNIYINASDNTGVLAAYPYSWNNSYYTRSNYKTIGSSQTVYGYVKDQAGNIGYCYEYFYVPIYYPPSPPWHFCTCNW